MYTQAYSPQQRDQLSVMVTSLRVAHLLGSHSLRFALAVAGLYFGADVVLNKIALGDGWQSFWPLNGVTIALLIQRPRKDWPWLLTAVALGTGVGEYLDGNSFPSTVLQRLLSMAEVTLGASLLPPFTSLGRWLSRPGLYARFLAAVLIGPALTGVPAAVYFYQVDGQPWIAAFNSWALADAMGIGATLPLVLALCSRRNGAVRGTCARLVAAGIFCGSLAVMTVIFATRQYPLIFMLYPLLMLVDWKLGVLGSSLTLWCACVLAVFLTEHGYGIFAGESSLGLSRELAVQLYLAFHLVGFLPISILFLQQRRMDKRLRKALSRTSALASRDALTNVANRRSLDERLEKQWQLAIRDRSPLALLMIDADHFKRFNDQFGHSAGDQCLRALAATLSAQVSRSTDLVARFGGEEFAVLLPNTALEGAREVAEKLLAAVQDIRLHPRNAGTQSSSTQPLRVTVSIGCAAFVPQENSQPPQLLELADQALYAAKNNGRNCVHVAREPETGQPGKSAGKLRARLEAFRLQR